MLALGLANMSYAQDTDYTDVIVVMQTEQGPLVIEFFADDAPNHVANFVELTQDGFYDNTIFHRIIPSFMIQGGDPFTKPGSGVGQERWGTGGPDTTLDAEFNDIMHNRGIVSMARSQSPDSAGSQFFIVHQDSNFLDSQYTVFGRLATTESYDTLDAIAGIDTDGNNRPVEPDMVRIILTEVLTRDQAARFDILDSDPPMRTQFTTQTTPSSQSYASEELNFSMEYPVGWLVQTLGGEGQPNIAAVGPTSGAIPPNIATYVEEAGNHTLNSVMDSKLLDLEDLSNDDSFQILSNEIISINNYDAFVLDAQDLVDLGNGPIDVKYREVTMVESGAIYTFLFSTNLDDFDSDVRFFDESLESFAILKEQEATAQEPETDEETETTTTTGGGCLIATAAFGSELAAPVQQLRELRDETLMQTGAGSGFVSGFNAIYYTFSPVIADYERENPLFRDMVRLSITPMIHTLSILNHLDMSNNFEVITYGIAVLVLTILVYVGPPVMAVFLIRRVNKNKTILQKR